MINTRKIRQILALVIIAATLAVAGTIALKAYRSMRVGTLLPSLPKNIDVSLQKIHYTETKGGVKKWDLVADKGEYDKVKEAILLNRVSFEVTMSGTTGNVVLTADRGTYHVRSKDIELVGKVVARSASGMTFTTEKATYQAARSMVCSSDRVKFTDGGLAVAGTGMEFNVETKQLKILKDVTADYKPGAEKHEK